MTRMRRLVPMIDLPELENGISQKFDNEMSQKLGNEMSENQQKEDEEQQSWTLSFK